MSEREAARLFGQDRRTDSKMVQFSTLPAATAEASALRTFVPTAAYGCFSP
jgi:hypothetical protein